ncbi:hypothetical protein DXG01_008134 [Tephrocybe rancida]|nr:hypothetical protein DXG01_008134 [Tephrocybe rancida]
MKFGSLVGLVSLFSKGAYGWGSSGHHAVGYVAMEFLAPKALSFVKESLGVNYSYSLGPAASFLGDIGQPLHVENRGVGGNAIPVTCSGNTTNLHALWDASLIEKLIASEYDNSVTGWAHSLAESIKYGKYQRFAADWVSCSSTTAKLHPVKATAEGIIPLKCPIVWAKDSNAYDCSYVFNYINGTDLCDTSYYDNAVPIIESQIAKQGYRLAAWLNVLFDGSVKGQSRDTVDTTESQVIIMTERDIIR